MYDILYSVGIQRKETKLTSATSILVEDDSRYLFLSSSFFIFLLLSSDDDAFAEDMNGKISCFDFTKGARTWIAHHHVLYYSTGSLLRIVLLYLYSRCNTVSNVSRETASFPKYNPLLRTICMVWMVLV